MAIATGFEAGLLKAVRGALGMYTLEHAHYRELSDEEIEDMLMPATDFRLFVLYESIRRGSISRCVIISSAAVRSIWNSRSESVIVTRASCAR